MTTAKLRALAILSAYEDAQSGLVERAVILTDGKAGTVENVWLDELHGLQDLNQGPLGEMACFNHQIRAARKPLTLISYMLTTTRQIPESLKNETRGMRWQLRTWCGCVVIGSPAVRFSRHLDRMDRCAPKL